MKKFENVVHYMDALALMRLLPDASVDAIVSDPPYNLTQLHFDKQWIDWNVFWAEARRILRDKRSPVILFSQQPFTTDLIMSNRDGWRYELIWEKTMPVGFLDANRRPLRTHENIQIFGDGLPEYWPQMESCFGAPKHKRDRKSADHYNGIADNKHAYVDNGTRYPRSVWRFAQRHNAFGETKTLHPTEKPLALMERLVLTYTQPDWIVLDPYCGSGTTGVAARNLGRRFILGDNDAGYCEVARKRLAQPYTNYMFITLGGDK